MVGTLAALQRTVNDHEKKIQGVEESLNGACDQLIELEGVLAPLT